jgi:hypothetical protein
MGRRHANNVLMEQRQYQLTAAPGVIAKVTRRILLQNVIKLPYVLKSIS